MERLLLKKYQDDVLISQEDELGEVMIFGTGTMGSGLYEEIVKRVEVVAYIDNDPEKQGGTCQGKKIFSVKEAQAYMRTKKDMYIMVASFFFEEEIIAQLVSLGLEERIVIPVIPDIVENDLRSEYTASFLEQIERSKKRYLDRETKDARMKMMFVVNLGATFSSFESIYQIMSEDECFEVVLVVSPIRKDASHVSMSYEYVYDQNILTYFEEKGYPYVFAYEKGNWIDIWANQPDVIFYNTVYQEKQLPKILRIQTYAKEIKIVYTEQGTFAGEVFANPEMINRITDSFLKKCWRVFLGKEGYEHYQSREEYGEKGNLVFSGSPKVDFYRLPVVAEKEYFRGKESVKILYTPAPFNFPGRSTFLEYHKYLKDLVLERQEIELIIRPHPFMVTEMIQQKLIGESQLEEIIGFFETHERTMWDRGGDYRKIFLEADFAIMDRSTINYEFLLSGKPMLYNYRRRVSDLGINDKIIEASYVIESVDELEETIAKLLIGRDDKKDKREQVVGAYMQEMFPHGSSNAAYICEYIKQNLRKGIL